MAEPGRGRRQVLPGGTQFDLIEVEAEDDSIYVTKRGVLRLLRVNRQSGSGTAGLVAGEDAGSLLLSPMWGTTQNVSGTGTSLYELYSLNNALSPVSFLFPGSMYADNNIQWMVPIPSDMDTTNPGIKIRLHLIIP